VAPILEEEMSRAISYNDSEVSSNRTEVSEPSSIEEGSFAAAVRNPENAIETYISV